MPKTHFCEAPEVERIARDVISKHHRHLLGVDVRYVFSSTTPTKGGKEVWGTARKVSSLSAFLAGQDDPDGPGALFVVTISQPAWEVLSPERRVALVDHELSHCWCEPDDEGNMKLAMLPHDLEEFNHIVQRHGMWRTDIERFIETANEAQPSLFGNEEARSEEQCAEDVLAAVGLAD